MFELFFLCVIFMVFVRLVRFFLGPVDTNKNPPGFRGGEQHPRRSVSKKMTAATDVKNFCAAGDVLTKKRKRRYYR